MNTFQEMLNIADIHANRIKLAIARTTHLFPLNRMTVTNMKENDILWIELLISRFGKLQDFLGSKLIDAFLEKNQENIQHLTMLDKLHKLERLELIENAEQWKAMREARNHISHEYPNHPELTAQYLNEIFHLAPQLLIFLDNLKKGSSAERDRGK